MAARKNANQMAMMREAMDAQVHGKRQVIGKKGGEKPEPPKPGKKGGKPPMPFPAKTKPKKSPKKK